jgi:hypothetical protein
VVTISAEALAFIRRSGHPIVLELPRMVRGCCFDFQEGPSVRVGEPPEPASYERTVFDGATMYVPRDLPDLPLEVRLQRFLGLRRLVVEGWRYF